MKIGKIVIGLVVAAVAVVAVVVFIGLSNIDLLVKTAVETVGPQVTKTDVKLQAVKLDLMEGRGELSGLTIYNPAGFSSDYAFQMGRVALQVDPQTLAGPVVVIKEILVDGAKLIAEQKDMTRSNLQALLENVKQGGSGSQAGSPAAEPAAEDSAGGDVRLMVEQFRFANSSVRVITEQWGERTLSIPEIKLSNLGDRKTGLTPEQLAQAMIQPVLAKAKKGVAEDLEELAKDKAEAKLKEKLDEKLSDGDKENLNRLKSLLGK